MDTIELALSLVCPSCIGDDVDLTALKVACGA
jgi:hypothetical protein